MVDVKISGAGSAVELPGRGLLRVPGSRELAWGAALLAALVAVSHQSYWIDEANAAWRAAEPSFGVLLQRMVADRGSDAQMPLFLAALWGWEKVAGHGEWALRAMNLLWFLPGLYLFAQGRVERLVAAGASAFVWFYLDEARPYGMQIGASLMVFGLLERALLASRDPREPALLGRSELWLLAFALVALSGSTLLGAIWAGAAVGGALLALRWRRRQVAATGFLPPLAALVAVLTPLAVYYGWTLLSGAGGTRVAASGLGTLAYSAYELLGLAGLGPGRTELRSSEAGALLPYAVPLALGAATTATVILAGTVRVLRTVDRRILLAFAATLGAATLVIFLAGVVLHWRVVGRHLAPLIPVVLAIEAAGLRALWERRSGRAVAFAFVALALTSGLELRFAARHAKDDYRSAAAAAAAGLAAGERVWWNADAYGAMIYGVTLGDGCGGALGIYEAAPGFAEALPAPDLVVASKPDIYDPSGAMAAYLAAQGYRAIETYPAFEIWQRPGEAHRSGCSEQS